MASVSRILWIKVFRGGGGVLGTLGTSSMLEKLWELKRFSKIFWITKVQNQHKWKRAAGAEKIVLRQNPWELMGFKTIFRLWLLRIILDALDSNKFHWALWISIRANFTRT